MANKVLVFNDKETARMTKILQTEFNLKICCCLFNIRLILCSFKDLQDYSWIMPII